MKRTFTSVIIFKRLDLIICNSLNSDDVTQNNVNPEFERKICRTFYETVYRISPLHNHINGDCYATPTTTHFKHLVNASSKYVRCKVGKLVIVRFEYSR